MGIVINRIILMKRQKIFLDYGKLIPYTIMVTMYMGLMMSNDEYKSIADEVNARVHAHLNSPEFKQDDGSRYIEMHEDKLLEQVYSILPDFEALKAHDLKTLMSISMRNKELDKELLPLRTFIECLDGITGTERRDPLLQNKVFRPDQRSYGNY